MRLKSVGWLPFLLVGLLVVSGGCGDARPLRPTDAPIAVCTACSHTHDAAEVVSGVLALERVPMGHGSGLDADLLDGVHASAFRKQADPVPWGELSELPPDFADGVDDGLRSIVSLPPLTGAGAPEAPLQLARAAADVDGYLDAEDFRAFAAKVDSTDVRLSDDRNPTSGSAHYIQNGLNLSSPQSASFAISGHAYVGGWLNTLGDMRVGGGNTSPAPQPAGWGPRLYLSGGPAVAAGVSSENTDELFLSRYNAAADRSELRVMIGDNALQNGSLFDKLVVGASDYLTNTPWVPLFSVESSGTVRARGSFVSNSTPDLAETISAAANVETGDVVCADPQRPEAVRRCGESGARTLLGVISDGSSAFLINAHGRGLADALQGKPLVLAGRVPVKVSLENGPIELGDELTVSTTPGFAAKSVRPGPVVGVALERLGGTGSGQVLAFIRVGEGGAAALARENEELRERVVRIERAVAALSQPRDDR